MGFVDDLAEVTAILLDDLLGPPAPGCLLGVQVQQQLHLPELGLPVEVVDVLLVVAGVAGGLDGLGVGRVLGYGVLGEGEAGCPAQTVVRVNIAGVLLVAEVLLLLVWILGCFAGGLLA